MNLWWIVRGSFKERLLCVVAMPSMGESKIQCKHPYSRLEQVRMLDSVALAG